ncbi:hypothetical protein ACFL4T_08655 [candidate division KSB1 bacterium]
MKRAIILLFMIFVSTSVFSQNLNFSSSFKRGQIGGDSDYMYRGVGIILGEPSGITGIVYLSRTYAIDGAVSWDLREKGFLHVHGDLLFHDFDKFSVDKGEMAFYYGLGGFVHLSDKGRVGIRIPMGIKYFFEDSPFSIFFEAAPNLKLLPDIDVLVNLFVGIRYLF